MVLIPRDIPGLEVVRGLHVMGYDYHEHGGQAELRFTDVRVPVTNLLGHEGGGFAIVQARLRPGRMHHCMRSIGIAERAIEMMCERAWSPVAFGSPTADQVEVGGWIAESRAKLEQLRLLVLVLVLRGWVDTEGNKGAHTEVRAIKIATPTTVQWILDKAIQVHGAGGRSQDFPLAKYVCRNSHPAACRRPRRGPQERPRQGRTSAPGG